MSIRGTASAIVLTFTHATRYMPWPCVCLSVCLSVTSRSSIETSELIAVFVGREAILHCVVWEFEYQQE